MFITLNMKKVKNSSWKLFKTLMILLWSLNCFEVYCDQNLTTIQDIKDASLTTTPLPITRNESLAVLGTSNVHEINVCAKNPDIQKVDLSNKGLFDIPDGSFDACKDLTAINLNHNQLTALPSNIFAENPFLESIKMRDNNLTTVDPGWFEACAKNLRYLEMTQNSLVQFPIKDLPRMVNLKFLHLSQNRIFDLDEVKIVEKFPNLEHITFQFNRIGCLRYNALVDYFKKNMVNTTSIKKPNMKCIADKQWFYLMLTHLSKEVPADAFAPIMLLWITLGISVFAIVLSFIMIAVFIFVYHKYFKKPIQGRHSLTDFGYYYNPFQEANENLTTVATNRGEQVSSEQTNAQDLPSYAIVERNRERI